MDQPEYGTNTSYVADFIEICLSAKLSDKAEIRKLYVEKGLSAAQIATALGLAKSFVLARLHAFGIRTVDAPKRYTESTNFRCPVPPFGYSVKNYKLVPSQAEMRICRLVVELIDRKGSSFRSVAAELSKRGIKNRSGSLSWGHATIQSIYKRWKGKL